MSASARDTGAYPFAFQRVAEARGCTSQHRKGGVVEEASLVAALKSGHLSAAGIDILEAEPPGATNELFALDQVDLSPHMSARHDPSAQNTARYSAET